MQHRLILLDSSIPFSIPFRNLYSDNLSKFLRGGTIGLTGEKTPWYDYNKDRIG